MEDDLSGDVDFDFFDSPGKGNSTEAQSSNPIISKPTVSFSNETQNRQFVSKLVSPDSPTYDSKKLISLPKVHSFSESLSESDNSKDYSDTFSDVSSVSSEKRKTPRSRSSSSASLSRSRSSSRESRSESENSSHSSSSRESSPPRRPSTSKEEQHSPRYTVPQRPSTAHHKSRKPVQKQAWEYTPSKSQFSSDKEKAESSKKAQYSEYSDASSRSGSSSDSDITDVSPLTSPRNSQSKSTLHVNVQYKQLPLNDGEECLQRDMNRSEDMDLSILMKALCDHEKEKQVMTSNWRVMFAPPKNPDRQNYTFSNDRATVIDRENQRLLNQLMKNVSPKRKERYCNATMFSPPQRLTSSALNRKREQRRIEMENLALLRRLQKVTPTKGMSRGDQIKEFERTTLYGVPLAATQHKKRAPHGYQGSGGLSTRSRSMSSVHSASTTASRRSTSSSTKRKALIDPRPQWCDRW